MIDFNKLLEETLDVAYASLTPKARRKVADAIYTWLATEARKKPVPDLPQRLNKAQDAIIRMCEQMKLNFHKGQVVITVEGSGEQIYKSLVYGSDWFEGHKDITSLVVSSLEFE